MLDTVITGGTVVTPAGAGHWDVGIIGEKIAVVAVQGVLSAEGARIIDARGKIVLPGGIETHAHAAANVQPGARQLVPEVPNAGPLEHSLGAIWGGTTTVFDFAPVPNEGTWRRASMTSSRSGRAMPTPIIRPIVSTPVAASPMPPPATVSLLRRGFPASKSSLPTSDLQKAGSIG